MSNTYKVSAAPHARDSITTQKIMLMVIIALLPATIVGVLNFGLYSLLVILISVASSILFEYLFEKITKRPITVSDGSAALTGLLIGMNMPPTINWWIPIVGSAVAIIVIKQLYGGLGHNFMNPALGARCFLLISFGTQMTNYATGNGFLGIVENPVSADLISGATPLAYLKLGEHFSLKALLLGNTTGVIGETSAIALLIGGIFLVAMKIIDYRIPVFYLGTFAVLVFITSCIRGYSDPFMFTLEELCAGGIMLGAIFMATDYVTSPITSKGRIIYAIALGLLTWIFRMIGKNSEGVSYAIIFINCLTPMIEHFTVPRAFGVKKAPKKKEEK